MRVVLRSSVAGILLAASSASAQVASVYTDIDVEKDCIVYSEAAEDEGGDWADYVCGGYRGYPVHFSYGDARESVFYGHAPAAVRWESFSVFNSTGPRIEWRVRGEGNRAVPFATIHRWFVSDAQGETNGIEVLVVEKVGQPAEQKGCAIAYVMATGNTEPNEKARRYADEMAADFVCGADEPSIDAGKIALPPLMREQ
jgi:hypothetical protein